MANNHTVLCLYGLNISPRNPTLLFQKAEDIIGYFGLNPYDFKVFIIGTNRYPGRTITYKKYQQVIQRLGFSGIQLLALALAPNKQHIDDTSFILKFQIRDNLTMISISIDKRVYPVNMDSIIEYTVNLFNKITLCNYGLVHHVKSKRDAYNYWEPSGVIMGFWDMLWAQTILQRAKKWKDNVERVASGQILRNIYMKNILSSQHLTIEILPNQQLGDLINEGYGVLSPLCSDVHLWSLTEQELKRVKKIIEKSTVILWV